MPPTVSTTKTYHIDEADAMAVATYKPQLPLWLTYQKHAMALLVFGRWAVGLEFTGIPWGAYTAL